MWITLSFLFWLHEQNKTELQLIFFLATAKCEEKRLKLPSPMLQLDLKESSGQRNQAEVYQIDLPLKFWLLCSYGTILI